MLAFTMLCFNIKDLICGRDPNSVYSVLGNEVLIIGQFKRIKRGKYQWQLL